MKKIALFLVALAPLNSASADTVEQTFQRAINREGEACTRVTLVEGIAKTSSGETVVAVACADGNAYAFIVKRDYSIEYISSCTTLERTWGQPCFN